MLSYNQIIKLNKEFADNHYVIQNFGNGERWQVVDHNQDATFKYPLMWMEDLISPVQDKEMVYSFRIWFVTRVEAPKDRDGNSIYFEYAKAKSDMIQCAQDIIAYWVQDNNYPSMDIDRSVSIETFIDTTDDKLAGCYADIRFRETFNYDSCIIPMDGVTPPPTTECEDVTVYVNGVLFGTIASGGTTDIGVHDSAGNDIGSKSGNNQVVSDVTTTVNGSSITNNKAETSKAITIRYADDSPVTVTPITDTESVFIGEVPNPTGVIAPFRPKLYQGTQVLVHDEKWHIDNGTFDYTYTTGSLTQQLDPNNIDRVLFDDSSATGITQHLFRFVGYKGGYYQESDSTYRDINGNLSTENDEFLVSGQYYGIDRLTWCGWRLRRGGSASLATHLSGAPFTFGGFSDYYIPPHFYHTLLKRTDIQLQLYKSARPPFDIQLTLWSCTYADYNTSNAWYFNTDGTTQPVAATGSRAANYIRVHNWGTDDSI